MTFEIIFGYLLESHLSYAKILEKRGNSHFGRKVFGKCVQPKHFFIPNSRGYPAIPSRYLWVESNPIEYSSPKVAARAFDLE
jgi:hypothetical protein